MSNSEIQKITGEQAKEIIETRKQRGLFMVEEKENGRFIGIDNTTGDAWTEDFTSKYACKRWLKNG